MITLWLSSYLLVHLDAVENSLVGDDYSVVEFLFVGSLDAVENSLVGDIDDYSVVEFLFVGSFGCC